MRVLLFLFVVVIVNLPLVHEKVTDHEVATRGREVLATVLDARDLDGKYLIDYRLPRADDPRGTKFSASVDSATYDYADHRRLLPVRMVPGEPGTNRPDGLVKSSLFTVAALSGDTILLLIAGLSLYRRRHPGDMPDPRPRPVGL